MNGDESDEILKAFEIADKLDWGGNGNLNDELGINDEIIKDIDDESSNFGINDDDDQEEEEQIRPNKKKRKAVHLDKDKENKKIDDSNDTLGFQSLLNAYRSFIIKRGIVHVTKPSDDVHICTINCKWIKSGTGGNYYWCKTSGMLHQCGNDVCNKKVESKYGICCSLTGRHFSLNDVSQQETESRKLYFEQEKNNGNNKGFEVGYVVLKSKDGNSVKRRRRRRRRKNITESDNKTNKMIENETKLERERIKKIEDDLSIKLTKTPFPLTNEDYHLYITKAIAFMKKEDIDETKFDTGLISDIAIVMVSLWYLVNRVGESRPVGYDFQNHCYGVLSSMNKGKIVNGKLIIPEVPELKEKIITINRHKLGNGELKQKTCTTAIKILNRCINRAMTNDKIRSHECPIRWGQNLNRS